MTRMLNVNSTPAYLLEVASLEPRTMRELFQLACIRHADMLDVTEHSAMNAVTRMTQCGFLARSEERPYRYTITRAGEEEANRVYDERMKRGAA